MSSIIDDNSQELISFIEKASDQLGISSEEKQQLTSSLKNHKTPEEVTEFEKKLEKQGLTSDELISSASVSLMKEGKESNDMRYILSISTIAQKLKLAIFGNASCRALLVMDNNHMIQTAAMKNPRMQINEVEAFSKNPFISDYILSIIGDSRTWTSNYSVKRNLVFNPKTPSHVSLRFVRFLMKSDLRLLTKSKSVPQVVALSARRRISDIEKGK